VPLAFVLGAVVWAVIAPSVVGSTPTETRPAPWTIAGYGMCVDGSLSIGNATDQEITFISGKFVVEHNYEY
jgi:hypothetical protein